MTNFNRTANILASSEAGGGNCLPFASQQDKDRDKIEKMFFNTERVR